MNLEDISWMVFESNTSHYRLQCKFLHHTDKRNDEKRSSKVAKGVGATCAEEEQKKNVDTPAPQRIVQYTDGRIINPIT